MNAQEALEREIADYWFNHSILTPEACARRARDIAEIVLRFGFSAPDEPAPTDSDGSEVAP